jgi:hypothetical protein
MRVTFYPVSSRSTGDIIVSDSMRTRFLAALERDYDVEGPATHIASTGDEVVAAFPTDKEGGRYLLLIISAMHVRAYALFSEARRAGKSFPEAVEACGLGFPPAPCEEEHYCEEGGDFEDPDKVYMLTGHTTLL